MVVGVASAAIVVAGLSGCSNSKPNTSSPSATGAAGATQVIVDGQNQNVTGQVSCTERVTTSTSVSVIQQPGSARW
jgi:ipoprotein LpqH